MSRSSDITVERHAVDGFTLWGTSRRGYYLHRRYIFFTVAEAKRDFRAYLREN